MRQLDFIYVDGDSVEKEPSFKATDSMFELARRKELALVEALSRRLTSRQFLSHRTAALWWGAPVPYLSAPELHMSAVGSRAPQVAGVIGHSVERHRACITLHEGAQVASPELTFAMLGRLPLAHLVAVGDYLVRVHRPGVGRRGWEQAPLSTVEMLRGWVSKGRWPGTTNLHHALELVREDSWSPQESIVRVHLVLAGLPEPELNVDLFDKGGSFIGCVDFVYRQFKVALEYHGEVHRDTWAQDVERIERLRANGWLVLQITRELAREPEVMVARVGAALRSRGWE